jgi:hypothetical protein
MSFDNGFRGRLGMAHKPALDKMSPAQIRVVCEHLLYTMETKQRESLMKAFPGLYLMLETDAQTSTLFRFQESLTA